MAQILWRQVLKNKIKKKGGIWKEKKLFGLGYLQDIMKESTSFGEMLF